MTAALSDVAAVTPGTPPGLPADPPGPDPHAAPKLSPDDPRLALRRGGGRTLRSGPLVALVAALSGVVVLAVAFAFETPSKTARGKDPAAPSSTPSVPVVPESIRNASARPLASSVAHADRTSEPEARRTAQSGSGVSDEKIRQDQKLQSEHAPILFERMAGGGEESPPAPGEPRGGPAVAGPAMGPAAESSDSDPNGQLRKNAFVDGQGGPKTADYTGATVQHPRSPYELKAGTILPAVLITAINSDLPGPVVGQVRENVYDTVSGNTLSARFGERCLRAIDWARLRARPCRCSSRGCLASSPKRAAAPRRPVRRCLSGRGSSSRASG